MALEAKTFMREVGEGIPSDELIMRATVAYNMLKRGGFKPCFVRLGFCNPTCLGAPLNAEGDMEPTVLLPMVGSRPAGQRIR